MMKVGFKTTGVTPQREVLLGNKSYCNVTSDRKTVIFSVVNDAFFSVSKVWKPGSKKNLNDQEFFFNYRFTRERYVTENVTGIWIDRFRIFANRATFGGCNGYTYAKRFLQGDIVDILRRRI